MSQTSQDVAPIFQLALHRFIPAVLTSVLRCSHGAQWWCTAASSAPAFTWKTLWWKSTEKRWANAPSGMRSLSSSLPSTTLNTRAGWQRARMRRKRNELAVIKTGCCIHVRSRWISSINYPNHRLGTCLWDVIGGGFTHRKWNYLSSFHLQWISWI